MSKTMIASILAAAGIFFSGTLSPDAAALAEALSKHDNHALEDFLRVHPSSPYVPDVVMKVVERKSEGGCATKRKSKKCAPGYRG